VTASEKIKARQEGPAAGGFLLDGELFLLRHLLVLKEAVVDFELGGGGGSGGDAAASRFGRDESVTGE